LLAGYARERGERLGGVMGASESASAFARILGPVTGGAVWTATWQRSDLFDYHTVFRLCALIMVFGALLALTLPPEPTLVDEQEAGAFWENH